MLTLLAAGVITVVSITGVPPGWQSSWVVGSLGACIVFFESVLGLFRWRDQWLIYRATAEALEREKSLFLVGAGPYRNFAATESLILLVERVEALSASENASWRELQERATQAPPSDGQPHNS